MTGEKNALPSVAADLTLAGGTQRSSERAEATTTHGSPAARRARAWQRAPITAPSATLSDHGRSRRSGKRSTTSVPRYAARAFAVRSAASSPATTTSVGRGARAKTAAVSSGRAD